MPDVERRVLAVVDALTVGANSVDLAGALIALDLDHSALALAALLEMSLCNTNGERREVTDRG